MTYETTTYFGKPMPKVLGVQLVWDDNDRGRWEEAHCKTVLGVVSVRLGRRCWRWGLDWDAMGDPSTAIYGANCSSLEQAAADAHAALELLIKKARKIEYAPPEAT